jgi:Domain of unknown function (DUF3786)/Putative Fe-S cluster
VTHRAQLEKRHRKDVPALPGCFTRKNRVPCRMTRFKTPLEIYALLPRTNCGDCGMATCLAFAAALLKEEKKTADCAHLDRETLARLAGGLGRQVNIESIRDEQVKELQRKIAQLDLVSRAGLTGAAGNGRSLTVRCLGRDFEVDQTGAVASQCHTHAWFTLPLLDYILFCEGVEPSGRWVPFRELPRGKTWNPLFEQRCEKPLKRIADSHSDLFEALVSLFSGTSLASALDSDIAVVLFPLPRVPMLVCYWRPEDGMESQLNLFFDETVERNLSVESLFSMATGIVRMLEKIMYRHTDGKSGLS